jgi:hypothetical protein
MPKRVLYAAESPASRFIAVYLDCNLIAIDLPQPAAENSTIAQFLWY